MENSEIHFAEQDMANLFCRPQVLVELIEACLGGGSPQSLADIILQDAALSARIIHAASKTSLANLEATEPVTSSIQQLGVPVVTGIALQAAQQIVGRGFASEELAFLNQLWFSSQVAGVTARCLAPTVSYPHVEEAQLSGLLLNLGMHIMFSQHGVAYTKLAGDAFSSTALCERENEQYQTDHLQVAEQLIEEWQLDSFLPDAVRFLHVDVAQIENGSLLLKIARLAQQFCVEPHTLTSETESLGASLFQFRQSESDYLFDWAHNMYQGHLPAQTEQEQRNELKLVLRRLTELIFVLADQESVRARLAGCVRPEDLVREARDIYLENSTASEAVFLLVDHKHNQLSGVSAQVQPRLISELKIPLDAGASFIAQALLNGDTCHSLAHKKRLAVTDQLLLRICKSRGFFCQPFRFDGRPLGVVVLGIDSERDLDPLQTLRLQMFAQVISDVLAKLSSAVLENVNEGSGLLRRVSHELNNPLTIISNYAEVLGHLLAGNENQGLTESIKREVRRIDDVLTYYLTRQELPRFPDHSISLNQLAKESVDALQDTELEPRHIKIRLDLKHDLERVATNGVLVKQILVNLLKNAAEAVHDGGSISLATRDSYCTDGGRYAEIVIQDDGPGIDQQVEKKLFAPVVSTKGAGHAGVGLSIVKGMVDDLGGRISYHSSTDSGTGFHLQIPCGEDDRSTAAPN